MELYDQIGKTYAKTRKSDSRIADKLLEILSSSNIDTVVDIGAGTGSYARILANYGYHVLAVEPSSTMRKQAIADASIEWIEGHAEKLPLPDRSVDAAIVMLAFHHFQNYRQALHEIYRVVGNGQIVLFTYDPAMISHFWLTEYFPSFVKDVESRFLSIPRLTNEIRSIVDRKVDVIPFLLPSDLADSFAAVGWARPELYLEGNIRSGISSFAKIATDELEKGLSFLKEDLEKGLWNQKYGHLRQQKYYDAGYQFIHTPAV